MKEKTNIFIKLKNNLYSIKELPKYMQEGLGRAIAYALLLCVICGVITGISGGIRINNNIKNTVQSLSDDKYKFEIKDGILTSKNSPLKIDDGSTVIYIDKDKTLSEVNDLRNITVHTDSSILLLKDGISISTVLFPSVNAKYNDVLIDMDITNESIVESINASSKIALIIFMMMNIIQTFISFMVDMIFIAFMLMLTNFMLGLKLRYSQVFSLVVYSATLPTVLITALTVMFPQVYFNLAAMIGTLLLATLVLRKIKGEIDENINIIK